MGDDRIVANKILILGKILYLRVAFPHELKSTNKYFIIVGFDENPLLIKINSANKITQMNTNLRECQFMIKASQYIFLKYDSYIDCGTVWYFLSNEELFEQISADSKRIICDVSNDHKNEIVRLTKISKSISPLHKRIIAQSLSTKKEIW